MVSTGQHSNCKVPLELYIFVAVIGPLFVICVVSATHTHTHTQPFYGSLDFVRDNPGEPVPEGKFRHLWIFCSKMKITQADAPTIWMDCHPIQANRSPTSAILTIFMQDSLPYTTLAIYPGLGQTLNMLETSGRIMAFLYLL